MSGYLYNGHDAAGSGGAGRPAPAKTGAGRAGLVSSCGVTLLELVVVMFIVSAFLAIVMPRFFVGGASTRAEARKVASIIRYLNETAAMHKTTLSVKFEFGEGLVTWDSDDGPRKERMEGLRGVEMQSRGMVREGALKVFFGPLGLGEHMWVHLGDGREALTVSFNPVSGRVKVDGQEGV